MTETPADQELFEQWRSGDTRAGSCLVRRHFDALHRFFSSKAQGQVEDLIQQTFVACIEARDAFRGESTFRAYILGIARLQLLTYYRKSRRQRSVDFTSTSVRDLGLSPTGALAQREDERLLSLALQHVPVDQQIALELTYWEGLKAPEIARVLGVPENTVYTRLRRAREHLRRALEALSDQADQRRRAAGLLGNLGEE
jgi:RNA polymerase sigma-70 factor (ECF subfamily)